LNWAWLTFAKAGRRFERAAASANAPAKKAT
jgi:hypothetical protein